jgi:uncharacterized Tic20 family protein
MNTTPTLRHAAPQHHSQDIATEERIWAVISHLSSLAFGMGILLPIVGWSDQRRKSNYASFQSLQALGYQSLGFTIWILSYLVLIILGLVILLAMGLPAGTAANADLLSEPVAIIFLFIVSGFFLLYFLLPIIAAIACAFGRDFRYPIMGDRLARYLKYDAAKKSEEREWLLEEHEFRWVAAMGHFSILIAIWGMLAPLTALILFGKKSLFLKFQSIQTLVYQAGTTILYFAGTFLYVVGLFALIGSIGLTTRPEGGPPFGVIGVVVFGAVLLIAMLIVLLIPLLHILGQWAGYRVLKGDNYRYPLVGKMAEKLASRKPAVEETPK